MLQTVFISPCDHKKKENESKKAMDYVVTFSEMEEWLDKSCELLSIS